MGGGGEGGGTDAANVTTSMVKMIAEGNAGATNGKWVVEVGVAMLVRLKSRDPPLFTIFIPSNVVFFFFFWVVYYFHMTRKKKKGARIVAHRFSTCTFTSSPSSNSLQVLTLIGSSAILLNMAYNEFYLKRAATVRMRLVQALVISDFLLGISSIVPSIVSLRQETYAHGSEF